MGYLHRCNDHVFTGLKPVQHVAAEHPRGLSFKRDNCDIDDGLVVILKCLLVLSGAVPRL